MAKIKVSPMSQEVVFQKKLKDFLTKEGEFLEACLFAYVTKDESCTVINVGMCGHTLLDLGEHIMEKGEARLKDGKC